nr:TIGR04140 family protein [Archaeoglobus neptunius]
MNAEEIRAEIRRVLDRLGFEIFEKDFEIVASRDEEKVRVEMRYMGKSNLNLPQTEVIFECAEDVHAEIIKELRTSRMGG